MKTIENWKPFPGTMPPGVACWKGDNWNTTMLSLPFDYVEGEPAFHLVVYGTGGRTEIGASDCVLMIPL